MKNKFRTILFFKDYFHEFFVKQRKKVRDKIVGTPELIEELAEDTETRN